MYIYIHKFIHADPMALATRRHAGVPSGVQHACTLVSHSPARWSTQERHGQACSTLARLLVIAQFL